MIKWKVSHKNLNHYIFYVLLHEITTSVAKQKHISQKPTEMLLNKMKEFIDKKRIAKIAKLEKSKKPEKRAQAKILKKRNRLDHIRIVRNNGATDLQLENSVLLIPLESRYYYSKSKELKSRLNELIQQRLSIDQHTKVIVYPSRSIG